MLIINESFYKPINKNSVFKNYILDSGRIERLDAKKLEQYKKIQKELGF
jgi:hypothetical protein